MWAFKHNEWIGSIPAPKYASFPWLVNWKVSPSRLDNHWSWKVDNLFCQESQRNRH